MRGETQGLLPAKGTWTSQMKDRIAFGQSLSVNGVQMAAAVNTIANGGVRVSPSLIKGSATTEDGQVVGTDTTTERRVISEQAAHADDADDGAGRRPRGRGRAGRRGARLPGRRQDRHRAARRRGVPAATTARFTVSFAGFAPADDPRFTIYVVVQNPTQRRRWRLGRRPGVREDHELRAQALRRPADRHQALATPRGVVRERR